MVNSGKGAPTKRTCRGMRRKSPPAKKLSADRTSSTEGTERTEPGERRRPQPKADTRRRRHRPGPAVLTYLRRAHPTDATDDATDTTDDGNAATGSDAQEGGTELLPGWVPAGIRRTFAQAMSLLADLRAEVEARGGGGPPPNTHAHAHAQAHAQAAAAGSFARGRSDSSEASTGDGDEDGGSTSTVTWHFFFGGLILFFLLPLIGALLSWLWPQPEPAISVSPLVPAGAFAEEGSLQLSHLAIVVMTLMLLVGLAFFGRAIRLAKDNSEGFYDRWMWVKIFSLLLLLGPVFTATFSAGPDHRTGDDVAGFVAFLTEPLNAVVAIALLTAGILYLQVLYSGRQVVARPAPAAAVATVAARAPPPAPAPPRPRPLPAYPQHSSHGPPCPVFLITPRFPEPSQSHVSRRFSSYEGSVQYSCPITPTSGPGGGYPGGGFEQGGRFSI